MKMNIKYCLFFVIFLIWGNLSVGAYSRGGSVDFLVYFSGLDVSNADISVLDAYSDIPDSLSAERAATIAFAVERGVLNGYEDGTLRLDKDVTRAELSCMIYRMRDCFEPLMQPTTYAGTYPDLAEWHRTESVYCMENGFLMGYGDVFGSDEPVSEIQFHFFSERMMYGISTREKYALLEICGTSPFSYTQALNAAYELPAYTPVLFPYEREAGYVITDGVPSLVDAERYARSKQSAAETLTTLLENLGNQHADKFENQAYLERVLRPFHWQTAPEVIVSMSIFENGAEPFTFEDRAAQTITSGLVRESLISLEPGHCIATEHNVMGTIAFSAMYGNGYEYFCYSSADNLPEGIRQESWYRRPFTARYMHGRGPQFFLTVTYGTAEPVLS